MVTYSSILAGRIPRTEESGGLQSTGITKGQTQLSTHKHLIVIRHTNKLLTQVLGTRDMNNRSTLREMKVTQSCLTLRAHGLREFSRPGYWSG